MILNPQPRLLPNPCNSLKSYTKIPINNICSKWVFIVLIINYSKLSRKRNTNNALSNAHFIYILNYLLKFVKNHIRGLICYIIINLIVNFIKKKLYILVIEESVLKIYIVKKSFSAQSSIFIIGALIILSERNHIQIQIQQ